MSLRCVSIIQTRSFKPGDLTLMLDGPAMVSSVQMMSEVSTDVELRDCTAHIDLVSVRSVKTMTVSRE